MAKQKKKIAGIRKRSGETPGNADRKEMILRTYHTSYTERKGGSTSHGRVLGHEGRVMRNARSGRLGGGPSKVPRLAHKACGGRIELRLPILQLDRSAQWRSSATGGTKPRRMISNRLVHQLRKPQLLRKLYSAAERPRRQERAPRKH